MALQWAILHQKGKCYLCNIVHPNTPLILEHLDGNEENNPEDGSNWAAACQSTNVKKGKIYAKINNQNSAERESVCVSVCDGVSGVESALDELNTSKELTKSEHIRPKFRVFVKKIVKKEENPRSKRILDGAAERFSISQMTAGRWLDGMCSPEGEYEYFKDDASRTCIRNKLEKYVKNWKEERANG